MTTPVHQYGDYARPEMALFLPSGAQRVLDVGCGGGMFGALLKESRPGLEVVGVEPDPEAAERASTRLDRVHVGKFPDRMPVGRFDCVYLNDVIEHMVDPGPALAAVRSLSDLVIASIPNVRHIDVVRALILHDDWTYRDEGVLDRTHVRFYTRTTAVQLFEDHGFTVVRTVPINCWSRSSRLDRLLRLVRDRRFHPEQIALVATVGGDRHRS